MLEIDFRRGDGTVGSTYEYGSFSAMDWQRFMDAKSKGQHFAYEIRNKRDAQGDLAYPAKRIK